MTKYHGDTRGKIPNKVLDTVEEFQNLFAVRFLPVIAHVLINEDINTWPFPTKHRHRIQTAVYVEMDLAKCQLVNWYSLIQSLHLGYSVIKIYND